MYLNKNLKENIKQKKLENEEKREVLLSIIKTTMELNNNRKNFEFAEAELIDYYLYQIKANQARLDYLIKKAKEKNIVLNQIDKIKYDIG